MKRVCISVSTGWLAVIDSMVGAYSESRAGVIRFIITSWISEHGAQVDRHLAEYDKWKKKHEVGASH